MYTLAPAVEADVDELVAALRPLDLSELVALNLDPREAILESLHLSYEAFTARDKDSSIICMAGVCPLGCEGVPWLMGTDRLRHHAKALLYLSRAAIARWLIVYPVLQNRVPIDYEETIRWVRWLGFSLEPEGIFYRIRKEAT